VQDPVFIELPHCSKFVEFEKRHESVRAGKTNREAMETGRSNEHITTEHMKSVRSNPESI